MLVFDQFEELFTIGQAAEERRSGLRSFLEQLADLVENHLPAALEQRFEANPDLVEHFAYDRQDFRVLLCLREDYLPHLENLRQRLPSIAENRMRLTRLDGRQALEAVMEAARGLGSPALAGASGP